MAERETARVRVIVSDHVIRRALVVAAIALAFFYQVILSMLIPGLPPSQVQTPTGIALLALQIAGAIASVYFSVRFGRWLRFRRTENAARDLTRVLNSAIVETWLEQRKQHD